jgi:zinc D-Ala-D-Ala carboxypeptidase
MVDVSGRISPKELMSMRLIAARLSAAASLAFSATALAVLPATTASAGQCSSSTALSIIDQGRTTFWNYHDVTPTDDATALKNVNQAASGLPAKLSPTQPHVSWSQICLGSSMLNGLYSIGSAWRLTVSELAGGTHGGPSSYHYAGRAVDIAAINGIGVSASNPYYRAVMDSCWNNGAVEVLGPGDAGHSTHIHCAF